MFETEFGIFCVVQLICAISFWEMSVRIIKLTNWIIWLVNIKQIWSNDQNSEIKIQFLKTRPSQNGWRWDGSRKILLVLYRLAVILTMHWSQRMEYGSLLSLFFFLRTILFYSNLSINLSMIYKQTEGS